MEKLPRCCAKFQSKLTTAQTDLRRFVQKAALRDQGPHPIPDAAERIKALQAVIVTDRQNIIDHEAEHAQDPEWSR